MTEVLLQNLKSVLQQVSDTTDVMFSVDGVLTQFKDITFKRVWEDLPKTKEQTLVIQLGNGSPIEFVSTLELADILLSYMKTADLPDYTTAISDLELSLLSAIGQKENTANKSNEIDDSTTLYPNNKAVNTQLKILKSAVQEVHDNVPYILQGTGTSEDDVMSQKAVTDALIALQNLIGTGGGDTGGGEGGVDLSNYLTSTQVHSAIMNITGNLVNLLTTNKMSLVGSINENQTNIANNISSITELQSQLLDILEDISNLQTDISAESSTRATADTTLQSNIDSVASDLSAESSTRASADTTLQSNIDAEASTRATAVTTLTNSISNIKQFDKYKATNETTGLTYSSTNPNVFVYWEE